MNLSFVHTVAASLPNSGHPLLSMGEFCPDIPCPSHELSQLKLNFLKRCQLQLRLRIKKNSKALNTTFYKLRIRRHFWLIEYPAHSTQVHTFPYRRGRSWSITSFFFLPESPPIPAGNQLATPAVQYPPMPSDPVSNPRPRPASFIAIPVTARALGDSVNDMSAESVSEAGEARERVQRLVRSWIGNAKTVLKIVSPVQLILCLLSC